MEWWIYFFVVFIGGIVGFLNTLAGSGSLISLPVLIFLGLDPNTANGTNRLSIFMQSIAAVWGYKKNNLIEKKEGLRFGVPGVIGAIAGAFIAVETKPLILNYIIALLLIIMVILLAFKPERWIKPQQKEYTKNHKYWQFVLFLSIGVYAGFLHASVGFFWLAALVLNAGYDLVKANVLKNLIVLLYMPFTMIIFALNDQVNYSWGLLMGIGSVIGARIAVKVSIKKGANFIRVFLLIVILFSAIKLIIPIFEK